MDLKEIKRVIQMVEEAQISHFSMEVNGIKIEVKKECTTGVMPMGTTPVHPIHHTLPAPSAAPAAAAPAPSPEPHDEKLISVKSQMVGTFYASAKPDTPALVKAGDAVKAGQVICIIEAMKLFNEIECEFNGIIEKVCVDNTTPVEYGQELFKLRLT